MKAPLVKFRQAGSFIAGLLIGLSIIAPVFALTGANASPWATLVVLSSATVLFIGVALQAAVVAKSPRDVVPPIIGITVALTKPSP